MIYFEEPILGFAEGLDVECGKGKKSRMAVMFLDLTTGRREFCLVGSLRLGWDQGIWRGWVGRKTVIFNLVCLRYRLDINGDIK